MLIQLLPLLILIPVLGCIGCLLSPRRQEDTIFAMAITAMLAELIVLAFFSMHWLRTGFVPVLSNIGSIYNKSGYSLSLDFYFDGLSAVFFGMATVMTTLVFIFSRYYMHREQGFKRFYSTLFLFFIGLSLIILSGNLEVLFVGWELIGISSVLLIAFYRDRFLPARNALKVFSVYRIADAFLLAAIWYAHHVFERSVNFADLPGLVGQHESQLAILGLLLLGAALIKSAQFPFSYWLPRAMEGPTTSSAIFYGALSVHMGVFLLLRTYPLWEGSGGVRITIALLGLVTAVVASSIARVQSSIKTQIAYASISQIGIMFIELAAGLQWLVLLHFVSNAALRTYQLLISPSVVSYLIHDQFYYFTPPAQRISNTLLGKLRATFYVLSIKEWNMNSAVSYYLWRPLKTLGRIVLFLDELPAQIAALAVVAITIALVAHATLSATAVLVISTAAAIVSIVLYVRAYTTKNSAGTGWNLILLGHLFGALFLGLVSNWNWELLAICGVGMGAAFIAGHLCLWYLHRQGESITLDDYHGAIYVFPRLGQVFFVLCLLVLAFPVSPSFLGQDVLLSFIPTDHAFQTALFCLSYVLAGVGIMRLYIKVFFGPHSTSHHEKAYRSS